MLALASFIYCTPTHSRNACLTNDECTTGVSCCFKEVISWFPIYEQATVGSCTKYLEEGQDCTFWGLSGCGCRPDLICKDQEWIFPIFPIIVIFFIINCVFN